MNQILRPDERFGLALRDLYHRHGYQPYRMSKFEAYDLYVRNKNFLVSENIITFTDTNGQLMALKPDVTLSIVKNAPSVGGALQKVYYHENVYRTSPAAMGYREIMQTGLECTGSLDLCAISEVLALAAESLSLLNSGEYLLDLGHMGVVSGLLEDQEDRVRRELLTEMGRKNAPAIRTVCAQAGISHGLAETLCRLALLYGTPETVLPQLKELGSAVQPALEELESLCALLEERGLSKNLRLDFSIVNDMNYYTGVIFRGYLPGLPSGVLAGGRYDNLLRRMGKQGGAIGFAVYLDQLERLDADTEFDVDVLLLYGPQDGPAAVTRQAERLAAQDQTVRMDRNIPQGLRYRKLIRFGEAGEGGAE